VIAAVGAASGLSLTLGAFAGGAAAVLLVIAMAGSGVQIERMLLAGVATSFMFSAATNLVLYSSDPEAAASWLFWSLGSFTRAQWAGLWLPVVVIVFGMGIFLLFSRQLQTLLAGDESARSMGVEAGKVRIGMLLLSSLITATLVAYCGGIGFVGLMIPHIVRRLVHASTSVTLVLTALIGGVFMIWIDVLARQLIENRELPIGVITAAVGSSFFLLVLRKPRWRDD
jgi:iron complex transport system permease protein